MMRTHLLLLLILRWMDTCFTAQVSVMAGDSSTEYAIIEGDIAIDVSEYNWLHKQEKSPDDSKQQESAMRDLIDGEFIPVFPTVYKKKRQKRAVTSLQNRLWPRAQVPYVIGRNITDSVKRNVYKAMSHWEKHTCIRFKERTNETDYIYMTPGNCGCCSFVGRRGGEQWVTLSPHCAVYGVVIHELGHVIGFWHEHSRPDRDRYIKIIKENIIAGKADNFARKSHLEIDSLGQPYDYYSIMHYRQTTFSKNSKNTIESLDPGVSFGQRVSLSPGDVVQASLLYQCPKPKCNEEFTKNEGNFTTPNYPIKYLKEHKCTWIINVFPGEYVSLEFTDFAVERSDDCTFDYVEIRQGIDATGHLIGRLCGEGRPGIINSAKTLWIRFKSDSSLAFRGFAAKYTKEKLPSSEFSGSGSGEGSGDMEGSDYGLTLYNPNCNKYLTTSTGTLISPLSLTGTPQSPDLQCSWTIDGGKNASRILLTFDRRSADEDEEHCVGVIHQKVSHAVRHHHDDKMEEHNRIYDKMITDRGDEQEVTYFTHDKYIKVRYNCLKSDKLLLETSTVMIEWSSKTTSNFKAHYIIDYDECDLGTSRCQHVCSNSLPGYTCSCHSGYKLDKNGWRCSPKRVQIAERCGSNLTSERGMIVAGTEPIRNCWWYVKLPSHYRIIMTFTKFSMPVKMNCTRNFLEVRTGNTLKVKGVYCGNVTPGETTSHSGLMAVHLYTDVKRAVIMPYFTAEYTAHKSDGSKCFSRSKAKGIIVSANFPKQYPPHQLCTWRLSAKHGYRVKVTIKRFDLEKTKQCKFDFVEFRDGRHRRSTLLGLFCGKIAPSVVMSTGRHIWIRFVSDSNGSGQGFQFLVTQVSTK